MKPSKFKKDNMRINISLCLALQITACLFQFIALFIYQKLNGFLNTALIISVSVTLIMLLAALALFGTIFRNMKIIDEKLNKIRLEMSDDPFWQEITGPYITSEVLHNIDRLFDRVKELANRDYKAELLSRQAEFTALQSQINPHFLYNTLDSIRGQALIEGADEIAKMTEALSTFFRYSISQKGDLVTLEEELKNVENYFFIQKFRFGNRFDYSIIMEDPEALKYLLPKLTIQPIVENSILHGLESKIEKGHIIIRSTLTAKRLILDISDNGRGMDKETLELLRGRIELGIREKEPGDGKRAGIAMSNVNSRIRLFFGNQYGISVSSTPKLGTNVQAVLPLVTHEQQKGGEFR